MNENFKKQISEIEDLTEIADIVSASTELKESISSFYKEPYAPLFSSESHKIPMYFRKKGDTIYLIGDYKREDDDNSSTVEVILDAAENKLVESALTVSRAGLFQGLIEACAIMKLGFDITSDSEVCDKEFLFKDGNQAILVSVDETKESEFVNYICNNAVEITLLGHVTKGELRLDDLSFGYIEDFIG